MVRKVLFALLLGLLISSCRVPVPNLDETPPDVTIALAWGPRVSEGRVIDNTTGNLIIKLSEAQGRRLEIPPRLLYHVIVTARDGGGIKEFRVQPRDGTFRHGEYSGVWEPGNQLNMRIFADTLTPRTRQNESIGVWTYVSDFGDRLGPQGVNTAGGTVEFHIVDDNNENE